MYSVRSRASHLIYCCVWQLLMLCCWWLWWRWWWCCFETADVIFSCVRLWKICLWWWRTFCASAPLHFVCTETLLKQYLHWFPPSLQHWCYQQIPWLNRVLAVWFNHMVYYGKTVWSTIWSSRPDSAHSYFGAIIINHLLTYLLTYLLTKLTMVDHMVEPYPKNHGSSMVFLVREMKA